MGAALPAFANRATLTVAARPLKVPPIFLFFVAALHAWKLVFYLLIADSNHMLSWERCMLSVQFAGKGHDMLDLRSRMLGLDGLRSEYTNFLSPHPNYEHETYTKTINPYTCIRPKTMIKSKTLHYDSIALMQILPSPNQRSS